MLIQGNKYIKIYLYIKMWVSLLTIIFRLIFVLTLWDIISNRRRMGPISTYVLEEDFRGNNRS